MMNVLDTLKNDTVKNMLVQAVENTKKTGSRFIGLTYTNQNGEKSKYNLIMGINLVSLYKSDLRHLQSIRPTLTGIDLVACDELISSITESLTKGIGNNSRYTLQGYYTPITQNNEVKLHFDDKTGETSLYIRGYVINKTTLVKGEYKTVKSSEKTLAKNKLEKNLKRGKLRTFKINVNALHSVSMNGMRIEIE